MFKFWFQKRQRKPLRFPVLEASSIKDHYLHRTSRFMQVGPKVDVWNSDHNPSIIRLTPWELQIFMRTEGNMTVREMIRDIEANYTRDQKVPEELDKVLLGMLEILIKDRRIIELSETPVVLPYYLSISINLQDEKKAKALMLKDGFKD